jgi:hypothetical protein
VSVCCGVCELLGAGLEDPVERAGHLDHRAVASVEVAQHHRWTDDPGSQFEAHWTYPRRPFTADLPRESWRGASLDRHRFGLGRRNTVSLDGRGRRRGEAPRGESGLTIKCDFPLRTALPDLAVDLDGPLVANRV